jgi:hypothetical protein
MRETRSSGSVQGAVSNHGPYCDLSTTQSRNPGAKSPVASRSNVNTKTVGLVPLKSATLGVFAVRAAGMYR